MCARACVFEWVNVYICLCRYAWVWSYLGVYKYAYHKSLSIFLMMTVPQIWFHVLKSSEINSERLWYTIPWISYFTLDTVSINEIWWKTCCWILKNTDFLFLHGSVNALKRFSVISFTDLLELKHVIIYTSVKLCT